MKHLVMIALLTALALIAGFGCDEMDTCDKHCAMWPYARQDMAEKSDGQVIGEIDECVDKCESACPGCLSELESEQKKAMKKCVDCVYSKVGKKPTSDEYSAAKDECGCSESDDETFWNDYLHCQDVNGGTCMIAWDMP